VAAYELGVQLGWCCVPETVVRREGPFGLGSIQRYVPEDGTSHYFTLRDEDRWERELVAICAFDVVANNADRRAGTSSWPRTGSLPSTTACASTSSPSCAP